MPRKKITKSNVVQFPTKQRRGGLDPTDPPTNHVGARPLQTLECTREAMAHRWLRHETKIKTISNVLGTGPHIAEAIVRQGVREHISRLQALILELRRVA